MPRAMRLTLRPYGVLGTVMSSGGIRKVAQGPVPGLAILDPAGLTFIQKQGPRGAGGAAGQIYRWLEIAEDDAFPAPVRDAIQAPLQAKLQYYGTRACLHVVGPNFNGRRCSRDEALGELTQAYSAVLHEFAGSRLGGLRLLPISGGIFSGPFALELPALTSSALRRAFDALPDRAQHVVSVARLDMCIFVESEYDLYAEAFAEETRRAQEFTDSLDLGRTPTQPWQTGR
eukprot:Transcript_14991.p1 GENE.Transcript_14991~~Transcript_14991.p1  ORF type:complete len:230 (-),score=40.77 Transcript_14991:47-736(-)